MTTTTTTGDKIHTERGTAIVRIPTGWWRSFEDEPICEDALSHDPATHAPDPLLEQTQKILLEAATAHKTKSYRVLELDPLELQAMIAHAEWYAYYWGDVLANEADDIADRGAWGSRGRSSRTLERRLRQVEQELLEALGLVDE